MRFDLHVGIDYSGQKTPLARTRTLQVYADIDRQQPQPVSPPTSTAKVRRNWNRKEIAEWLVEQGWILGIM